MGNDHAELPILPPLDARIPPWSLDKLVNRTCPICRNAILPSLKRPDRLPLAFCPSCQLSYVCALPPAEEIDRLYQGYWLTFRPSDLSPAYAAHLLSNPDLYKGDVKLNRLAALSRGLQGRSVLEIGCGCGETLVAARHRGARVYGNEIAEEACTFVRHRLQIPVFQGPLSASAFISQYGPMDMVIMSNLIEHPIEPLAMLEVGLNVLKPGGLLLILTPNGGEAIPELEQVDRMAQWVGFRVDLEHLQYFSGATIVGLAEKYGCEVEHLESFGYPALEGIDRQRSAFPDGSVDRPQSLRAAIKGRLRKSELARGGLRFYRLKLAPRFARFARAQPDPRSGSYHLLAILRKARASRETPPVVT